MLETWEGKLDDLKLGGVKQTLIQSPTSWEVDSMRGNPPSHIPNLTGWEEDLNV